MTMKRQRRHRSRDGWKRSGRTNHHHIKNRCRGGTRTAENLLLFDEERHAAFHFLFKNLTFKEAAELLLRCQRIKTGSRGERNEKDCDAVDLSVPHCLHPESRVGCTRFRRTETSCPESFPDLLRETPRSGKRQSRWKGNQEWDDNY